MASQTFRRWVVECVCGRIGRSVRRTSGLTFSDPLLSMWSRLSDTSARALRRNVAGRRNWVVQLESLESRTLLSAIAVTSALDNTTSGDGLTTLREAIIQANGSAGADTITFGDGSGSGGTNFLDGTADTITLSLGEMSITDSVTITGLSADKTIIDGNDASRIFSITSGDSTLEKLTLTGGKTTADHFAGFGGAIKSISTGTLTVSHSTLSGNSTTGLSARGGAIYAAYSPLTVRQSTVSGNSTTGETANGGAIFALNGAVTVSQSTVSGNSTVGNIARGGAIYTATGVVTVSQSTVTGNHTDLGQGGGISSDSSPVTMTNSIVAGNTDDGTSPDIRNLNGTVTVSHSLIGDNKGTTLPEAQTADGSGNFIGSSTGAGIIDPLLGSLANNGGPTRTHALLTGSLAINAGSNADIPSGITADQRGYGPRITNSTVDIGAYEFGAVAPETPSFVVTINNDAVNIYDGVTSLREAVAYANSLAGADTITFGDGSGIGGTNFLDGTADTITLSLGEMSITESLTITGLSAANTIVDGNNASRIFLISSGDTTLRKLTLMGGKTTAASEAGGAIKSTSSGTLTVSQSTLSGNSTAGLGATGGAIYSHVGAVLVSQSELSGNTTTGKYGFGGAVFTNSGTLTVSQSTLSGNSTTGSGSEGGAIYATSGAVTVSQSTISGNSTASGKAYGGAIAVPNAALTVSQSTLTGNHSPGGAGAINSGSSPLTITNSIVAGNTHYGSAPDDISADNGTLTVSHSLIGNNAGTDLTEAQTADDSGNLIGSSTGGGIINPLLGSLANNGGPTRTHAPLAASLAHNRGNNALIPLDTLDLDGDSNTTEVVPFDQRGVGFNRVIIGTVDMGAFEGDLEAVSLVVTTTSDVVDNTDGLTSLREAVAYANSNPGADSITFGNGSGVGGTNFLDGTADTITLSLGEMSITESLTITGLSADKTIIDGNNASRIFSITSGNSTLEKLTLTGGRMTTASEKGGAIRSTTTGTLTVSQSTLSGNSTTGNYSHGGAIYAYGGAVTVNQSTLSGNSTTGGNSFGGAVSTVSGSLTVTQSTLSGNSTTGIDATGGAIFSSNGSVTVTQSTVSGNSTAGLRAHGGAIFAWGGPLIVNQSTITGNDANLDQGGGIYSFFAPITIKNSIVAGNTDDGTAPDIRKHETSALTVSRGLIGDNTGTDLHEAQTADGSGNFIGSSTGGGIIDPLLGALASNGGPTRTHALLTGSLAINAGSNADIPSGITADQRGYGPRITNSIVDIGAYEFGAIAPEAPSLVVTTHSDVINRFDGVTSLREAVAYANSLSGADTITFGDGSGLGGTNFLDGTADTIALSLGEMSITESLTITGLSADKTIINGNNASRIFSITRGDTTLEKLTLTGGKTTASFLAGQGGAIKSTSTGKLTVSQSTLSGNSTVGNFAHGGAIAADTGEVAVSRSTLIGNSTTGLYSGGGAIFANNGAVTVSQSTLSGNFTAGEGAAGGAVFNYYGDVTVSQSTLSGNFTTGTRSNGGAVAAPYGTTTVTQSTLTANHADAGGAVFISYSAITITNSIVAGNTDNGTAPDIHKGSGSLTVSHSLIGDNTGTGLTEAQTADGSGNFIGSSTGGGIINPQLGPLANNGGPTRTHALLTGSLAIDHGSNASAVDVTNGNTALVRDQRGVGFIRILDGDSVATAIVDMGAVEFSGLRLTNPSQTTNALRPTLTWTAIAGATSYNIWVSNQSTGHAQYYLSSSNVASQTVTSNFAIGRYRVWIQPVFVTGVGNWSRPSDIFVLPPVVLTTMPKVQLVSRPPISWNALPGAVKYDLWIDNVTTNQSQFVRQDVTGTSFTPSADLPMGIYRVWVRAVDKIGNFGAWSPRYDVQVLPGATPIGPLSATFDRTPTFSWQPVTGAVRYEVYVRNSSAINVYNGQSTTATNWTPTVNLPDGQYRWWVVAVNAANFKSGGATVTDLFVGGRPTIVAPVAGSSSSNRTPTFTWKAVDGAVSYNVQVNRVDVAQAKIINVTGRTGTSFTATSALPAGTYRVWVQAVSSTGSSPWSMEFNTLTFTITATSPELNPLDGDLQLTGLLLSDFSRHESEIVPEVPPLPAIDDRDHEDTAIDQIMVQIYGERKGVSTNSV